MKVSGLTIAFLLISVMLTLVSPLVFLFYGIRTLKGRFLAAVLGIACYLFFGLLFPSATLNLIYFISEDLFAVLRNGWGYVILMSLISALWIEVGRYNVQKISSDLYPGPTNALVFGLGFATLPSVLVGIGFVTSMMLAFSINQNGLEAFLAQMPADTAEADLEAVRLFAAESPLETLWKMLVQVSLYVVQVVLSLLMQPAVEKGGEKKYFLLCLVAQFLLQWTLTMRDAGVSAQNWLTALLTVVIAAVIVFASISRFKILYPDFKLIQRDYRPIGAKMKRRR